ncbi:protein tyrosine phosphatase family protein [Marinicella sp. W31]|uniref:protein tyrosine phosphatase family protein n=1 Tax=Marinicella sp. W31 TaxID=3023713 RepID=UPI003757FBBE
MKNIALFLIMFAGFSHADKDVDKALHEITNFRFVSPQLASSGMLDLESYQYIKAYGFEHVINLIPGNQIKERKHVQSLGLSYQQIAVDWGNPTLENFEAFVRLMKSYGDHKVYVHCEMNMRASAFVYLYRVTELQEDPEKAIKDMLAIWTPKGTWQDFIDAVLKS